ncbi:hypothetical protein RHMOL_Rhmol04G0225600 [Rhododendron molle]|uniref:Uncharacterized protein n=1 Tax=Rhododendron molle TaxID=49168 RepID=A0ACC0P335_RHOML|nr:hypothetical protein RHMOL_Rhmol04G0225600 [Rhododendron molle]
MKAPSPIRFQVLHCCDKDIRDTGYMELQYGYKLNATVKAITFGTKVLSKSQGIARESYWVNVGKPQQYHIVGSESNDLGALGSQNEVLVAARPISNYGDGHVSTQHWWCCSVGLSERLDLSKKHLSIKILVIILLTCVLFTTLAFIASVACYVYGREKCHVHRSIFLSDTCTSYNSATNLISHKTSSTPGSRVYTDSPIKPITGCIRLIFRSNTETIHGTILQFSYPKLEDATNKFSDSILIAAHDIGRAVMLLLLSCNPNLCFEFDLVLKDGKSFSSEGYGVVVI